MRRASHFRLSDQQFGLLLALPAIAVLVLIVVFPFFDAIKLSLFPLHLLHPTAPVTFAGLSSFAKILSDRGYILAMLHTFAFVITTMTIEFLIGLSVALIVSSRRSTRAQAVFRTMLVLPLMVAPIVSGLQWRWIFSDQYGVLNYLLQLLHLPQPVWLGKPFSAMVAVLVANLWVAAPFDFLVLLAGLQSIPDQPLEAAVMDGASWLQRMRFIILPMLKPAILVVLLIRLADAVRIFGIVYVLTHGGPGDSTEVFSTYIYRVSYGNLSLSQGAAGSMVMLAATAVISVIIVRIFRPKQ